MLKLRIYLSSASRNQTKYTVDHCDSNLGSNRTDLILQKMSYGSTATLRNSNLGKILDIYCTVTVTVHFH
jgi:hypothetical protein